MSVWIRMINLNVVRVTRAAFGYTPLYRHEVVLLFNNDCTIVMYVISVFHHIRSEIPWEDGNLLKKKKKSVPKKKNV